MDRISEGSELTQTYLRVTRSNVQSKALELAHVRGNEEFHASNGGWVDKFLKRNSFSLHRRTTVDQRLPQDLITMVVGFIMTTRRLCRSQNYPLSFIGNMDETPLCQERPQSPEQVNGLSLFALLVIKRADSLLFFLPWLMGGS